jgi:hypothetical protein
VLGDTARAASSTILITQIQAGGVGAATQEFIVLYNNSSEDVDVTGWCLTNKNNIPVACFDGVIGQTTHLPAYANAVLVSTTYAESIPTLEPTLVYTPISQSSGSITGSADTISLLDQSGLVIDSHSWVSSLVAGTHYERFGAGDPIIHVDTDTISDWLVKPAVTLPSDGAIIETTVIERVILSLIISELLPNAAGADEGKEFIELYNPNETSVVLDDYWLYVGLEGDDRYTFPPGSTIEPGAYKVFSNTEIDFSLLNSSSRVAVTLKGGTPISETPLFIDPPDDQSWALINEVWSYTNNPTPGSANIASTEIISDATAVQVFLKPCAANQYRSLETNRCRLIPVANSVTACKDGQYRSEETNRCRNIASDVTVPAPCAEGEVRNADTNRCRKIANIEKAEYGVLGAQTKSDGSWYGIAAIAGIVLAALSYAIWEWHREIARFFMGARSRIRQFVRRAK